MSLVHRSPGWDDEDIDAEDDPYPPNRLSISLLALHRLRWRFRVRQRDAVAAAAPGALPACSDAPCPQGARLPVFPALALFDKLGPRRSQFGAHAFQRLHIAGPAHLQGLVLRSRQAQCVAHWHWSCSFVAPKYPLTH